MSVYKLIYSWRKVGKVGKPKLTPEGGRARDWQNVSYILIEGYK